MVVINSTKETNNKDYWANNHVQSTRFDANSQYRFDLAEIILETDPKKILEFGCNSGRNLRAIELSSKGWVDLYGIDMNEQAIQVGKKSYTFPGMIKFVLSDEKYLDILIESGSRFDVAFTVSVLDHNLKQDAERIYEKLTKLADRVIIVEPLWKDKNDMVIEGSFEHIDPEIPPFTYSWDYLNFKNPPKMIGPIKTGERNWGNMYYIMEYRRNDEE